MMKPLSRLFVIFTIVLLIVVAQISPAKASPKLQESNPAAEEYVKSELLNTGVAVLGQKFRDPQDRVVSGAFIAGLFKDPDLQTKPYIKIYNATIVGGIEAGGISIPFNVEFHDCVFEGRIYLDSAEVKTFRIDDSTVKGSVRLGRLVAKGDVALYRSTFEGEVSLFDADIASNLFARQSKFLGVVPDTDSLDPFELWKTQVGQTTEFTNSIIKGKAIADDAKFGVDVKFDGAVFEQPASFKNIEVGSIANFQGTRFKNTVDFSGSKMAVDADFTKAIFNHTANFENFRVANHAIFTEATFNSDADFTSSIMDRDIEFTGAVFSGEGTANFDYVSVARFFDFDNVKLNEEFSFQYSTIGWPYFAGTVFNDKVNFEGMQASNDFELAGAVYNYPAEPFTVYLAKVSGRVLFAEFSAKAGLDLSSSEFGALTITGQPGNIFGEIILDSTKVDGDLDIENAHITNFSTRGLTVGGGISLVPMEVSGTLDMSNAELGFLTIEDKGFWSGAKPDFDLHGMTYSDLGFVTASGQDFKDKELDTSTKNLLTDMVAKARYSPQVYQTLEQFLTEKGHPDWAADVELDRKIRERKSLEVFSISWFWSWFLFLFSGYGQRPIYALGWSVAIILMGAWFFSNRDDFIAVERGDDQPKFNPVLYSLALFIPFFEFGFDKSWDAKPTKTSILIYKQIHRLLGWIVAPIALLAFSGIIK
ncbi:MAG TPA: pentapeptide repeat-containing protein [Anaerolineales bacterium]|nr:pentapeptide repeat-containing protein [Anaerolineales bacterium]